MSAKARYTDSVGSAAVIYKTWRGTGVGGEGAEGRKKGVEKEKNPRGLIAYCWQARAAALEAAAERLFTDVSRSRQVSRRVMLFSYSPVPHPSSFASYLYTSLLPLPPPLQPSLPCALQCLHFFTEPVPRISDIFRARAACFASR